MSTKRKVHLSAVKPNYFTSGSRRRLALRGAFRSSAIDGAGLSIGRDRSLISIELPERSIWSVPTAFTPLNFLLADLAIGNQCINTCLCSFLTYPVHAKTQRVGFNPIFTTMLLVIACTSLLHRLTVDVLRRSRTRSDDCEQES